MVRFVKLVRAPFLVIPGLTRDPASLVHRKRRRKAGPRVKPGATIVFVVWWWCADYIFVCAVLPIVMRVKVKVLETARDL
jgi:hypothetical protein